MPEGPPHKPPSFCAQLANCPAVFCLAAVPSSCCFCVIAAFKFDADWLTDFFLRTEQYWMLFQMFVDAFSAILMASKGQYLPDTPLGKRLQQLCFECGALRTIFAYAHPSRCLSIMSVRLPMPMPGLAQAGHLATLGLAWPSLHCKANGLGVEATLALVHILQPLDVAGCTH